MPGQLLVVGLRQPVGPVIGREGDDGVLQPPAGLQLLDQIGHCLFQLDVGGDIALDGIWIGQLGDSLPVAVRHIVDTAIIKHVAAEGQKIGTVVVAGRQRRPCLDHHLIITVGVMALQLQPIADTGILIAHVGVRFVPRIIGVGIVVEGIAVIPDGRELVAKAEGHTVFGRIDKAPGVAARDEPHLGGVFTVKRADGPQRCVEIGELKALVV